MDATCQEWQGKSQSVFSWVREVLRLDLVKNLHHSLYMIAVVSIFLPNWSFPTLFSLYYLLLNRLFLFFLFSLLFFFFLLSFRFSVALLKESTPLSPPPPTHQILSYLLLIPLNVDSMNLTPCNYVCFSFFFFLCLSNRSANIKRISISLDKNLNNKRRTLKGRKEDLLQRSGPNVEGRPALCAQSWKALRSNWLWWRTLWTISRENIKILG